MFDALTTSLQRVFKNLRGYGRLSEKNIQDALRDVRIALLEADVHYLVVKEFIARVKERCLGRDVLDSVTPGQQVIKHVHEEMVALLGRERREVDLAGSPAVVLLLGLHGAGKTTTAGKLARQWKQSGKRVMLAAGDIRRPAAVDQLRILAEQAGVLFTGPAPGDSVPEVGKRALAAARRENADLLVCDTGGRFQLDEELVDELKELKRVVSPNNVVLVLDAATGQEAVNVARTFHQAVGLTGLILTKLDGDARGGAALSIQHVVGCPILAVGTGERPDDLAPFYPDRMASRILGMGDVVSLVEKAREAVDAQAAQRLDEKLRKNRLDLEDFLEQLQQLRRLGPIENLLEMLPGAANVSPSDKSRLGDVSGREMKRAEAIIRSMTPRERRHPEIINASRRRRIAAGSGTDVASVNDLLRRFEQARKMARRFKQLPKGMFRFGPR
jgi:signal recognition particle subunit SRP54